MEHLFDGFLAAHSINIEADPTSDAVEAMQRLLDGVPERWRDADLAWWPNSAIDMWTEPKPQRSTSDRGAARIQHSSLLSTMEALPALSITLRSEYPVSAGNPLCAI